MQTHLGSTTTSTEEWGVDSIIPLLNTKIKCSFGKCEHKTEIIGEETHDEGLCWKVTQDDFADEKTEAKYCPCKKQPDFIRRYARLGYMERGEHDIMITRKCVGCDNDLLFTINETLCLTCKVLKYGEQETTSL